MESADVREIILCGLSNGSGLLSEPWDDAVSDVDDERVLQMGVALELHRRFPSRVGVETLVRTLSPTRTPENMGRGWPRNLARVGTPIPTTEHQGKIDVVLYRDDHKVVPELLIEVKRAYALPQKIIEDVNRCKLILECYNPTFHCDMLAYCAFPVLLNAEAEHDQAIAENQLTKKLLWAEALASALSAQGSVSVSTHFSWRHALRQPAVEGHADMPETLEWNSDGFILVPFAFELKSMWTAL